MLALPSQHKCQGYLLRGSFQKTLRLGDHVELAYRYLATLGPHAVFTEGSTYVYEDREGRGFQRRREDRTFGAHWRAAISVAMQVSSGIRKIHLRRENRLFRPRRP